MPQILTRILINAHSALLATRVRKDVGTSGQNGRKECPKQGERREQQQDDSKNKTFHGDKGVRNRAGIGRSVEDFIFFVFFLA